MNKSNHKKRDKEISLLESAYELFTEKGVTDTTINNIVEKAGVAKGTFYLYFDNKYDLLDKIILDKSQNVLAEAIKRTGKNKYDSFEDEVISFVDYIIEYLKENKLLLRLIHKNLSWGIFRKAYRDYEEVNILYNMFEKGYEDTDVPKEEVKLKLFLIVELVGAVSYSAIILEEPVPMDDMKEILFDSIKKIL